MKLNIRVSNILGVILLLAYSAWAKPQKTEDIISQRRPFPPSRLLMFASDGVTLIGEIKGNSFILQPYASSPNLAMRSVKDGISIEKARIISPLSNEPILDINEETILRFENASVEARLGWGEQESVHPTLNNFEGLLNEEWKGIQRFSWGSNYFSGTMSINNVLTFDVKKKTLEKTLDFRSSQGMNRLKVRFQGVSPKMLTTVWCERPIDADSHLRNWTNEQYLPLQGVRVVEILETSGLFQIPDWKRWKVKIVWRCPRREAKRVGPGFPL